MDAAAVSDQTPFSFRREKATCKELFDAFLTTYSNFTYTHDPKTGVIWFHPKGMNFNDILSQRVGIAQGAKQVPMFTDIYLPLLNLLAHKIIDSREETPQSGMGFTDPSTGRPYIPQPWLYDVDLPAGAYSVREVLDFCCVANPTKAILVRPARPDSDQQGSAVIVLKDLIYANPLAPPRVGAIRYWELEIGKSTNGIPSLEEVRAALCDPDSRKRCAASLYLEASQMNYALSDLVGKANGSDQAVWTAIGIKYALFRDANEYFLTRLMPQFFPQFGNELKTINNPDLALLLSLQLMVEKQDTKYFDAIVGKHTYSNEAIASIKPELVRMARSSKAIVDKLSKMNKHV